MSMKLVPVLVYIIAAIKNRYLTHFSFYSFKVNKTKNFVGHFTGKLSVLKGAVGV